MAIALVGRAGHALVLYLQQDVNMSDHTIRRASEQDIPAIQRLIQSLSDCYLCSPRDELPTWFSATLSEEALQLRLSSGEFLHLVAMSATGEVVGYLAINQSHVYHLFVDAEYQQQGIARRLWQSAMTQTDYQTFTVRASLNAVPVYEAFGFTCSAPQSERDGIRFQPMQTA